MINMGYCRYSNTLEALRECFGAMLDDFDGADISARERTAMLELVGLCQIVANDYEHECSEMRAALKDEARSK